MTELRREPIGVAAMGSVGTVPCMYCREPIAADRFAYWSAEKRLLSAACPACQRRVTLSTETWRGWIRESGTPAATA
jgi:endogenous inhibitor of DNA gyrase (YacG/DUF329 family)